MLGINIGKKKKATSDVKVLKESLTESRRESSIVVLELESSGLNPNFILLQYGYRQIF